MPRDNRRELQATDGEDNGNNHAEAETQTEVIVENGGRQQLKALDSMKATLSTLSEVVREAIATKKMRFRIEAARLRGSLLVLQVYAGVENQFFYHDDGLSRPRA